MFVQSQYNYLLNFIILINWYFRGVNNIYNEIYSIYQMFLRDEEKYELVLGVGLLSYINRDCFDGHNDSIRVGWVQELSVSLKIFKNEYDNKDKSEIVAKAKLLLELL